MKFNIDIISETLSKQFKIVMRSSRNNDKFIDHILMYNNKDELHNGYLYICRDGLIPGPSKEIQYAAVSIGIPECDIFPDNFIALPPGSDTSSVFNCILELFATCNEWMSGLHKTIINTGSIEQMLINTSPLLGNPIYLHDQSYRMIAMTDDGTNATNFPNNEWLISGRISPGFVREILETRDFAKLFSVQGVGYWERRGDHHLKFSYLFYNFHVNGQYAGRMVIYEKNREFTELDRAIVEELCRITEIAIRRLNLEETSVKSDVSMMLINICTGTNVEENVLETGLRSIDWSADDRFFCFSLKLYESDFIYKTVVPLCRNIEERMRDCLTFVNGYNIGGVVRIHTGEDRDALLHEHLLPILENYDHHAGVSSVFTGINGLEAHWRQANYALYLRDEDGPQQLHMFDNLLLEYLVNQSFDEFGFNLMCPDGLRMLIEYDRENYTEFVHTLQVFLENDRGQKKSAELLHVHRSTFLYRLNRIIEISQCNFEDINDRLLYMFSIKMYEQEKKKEKRWS